MASNNAFYNPTKKRRPLQTLDESVQIKRPDENRLPLIKMARTTRTFWTQNEAIEYMAARQKEEKFQNLGEILYLFTFESHQGGTRRYQVADIDVFFKEYYEIPANQRHTYEIIVEKKPSKLYFDLEYDIAANRHINGPKLTNNFIQFVLTFMKNRSDDLTYSFEDVLILDSTSSTKFSRHLIFQTKDPFLDNQAVGRFVNLILEDVHGCLINHRCSAISSGSPDPIEQTPISTESSVFAKNLLSTLERRLQRFENCQCIDDYSQMHFKDIAEFLVRKSKSGGITWFCDMGVYTKNRAFRLIDSSKYNKRERFTLALENKWKPTSEKPNENKRLIFLASLVYFNGPIRRFIHVDEENPPTTKLTFYRTHSSSYITEDLDKVAMDYPELVDFMETVAQERTSNNEILHLSRLYKAREVQNDFRWEISFMYKGDYKFCENIKRHHKNNNIYFVVDMRKGTYRQKCHDFDCRTFAGVEHALPPNATPWLTIVDQDWDSQSPPSMKETL